MGSSVRLCSYLTAISVILQGTATNECCHIRPETICYAGTGFVKNETQILIVLYDCMGRACYNVVMMLLCNDWLIVRARFSSDSHYD